MTFEELGGALTHNQRSGVAHFMAKNEAGVHQPDQAPAVLPAAATTWRTRRTSTSGDDPDRREERLATIVPDDPNKPYDMKELIGLVVDRDSFMEVQQLYAPNIIVGFARLGGHSVGIIANQPRELAGCLDINSSIKGARFIRFCDGFNIPIVTFEDVPGFMPGTNQEWMGVIKHGAKLLYAYCEATVPKLHGDHAQELRRRLLRDEQPPGRRRLEPGLAVGGDRRDGRQGRGEDHPAQGPGSGQDAPRRPRSPRSWSWSTRRDYLHPYIAAEVGYIDDVIDPRDTRPKLIAGLEMMRNKVVTRPRRKHGNIPL